MTTAATQKAQALDSKYKLCLLLQDLGLKTAKQATSAAWLAWAAYISEFMNSEAQ